MCRPALLFFALALLLLSAGYSRDRFDQWVAATDLPALVLQSGTQVLDRDGKLLRAYTVADGRWRLHIALADVDPAYIAALLAYEDKRFRSHSGVDPRSLTRALWQAIFNGRVVSGGSTLTMQVARLLEASGTGALDGKLRQMRVALALERRLSKDEILELYLNLAPFGGNVEGLRAASLAYFAKEPRRLTPSEAALLVAIPQSPERRRPAEDRGHGEEQSETQGVRTAHIDDGDVLRGECDKGHLERQMAGRGEQHRHHERDGGPDGARDVGLQRFAVHPLADCFPWSERRHVRAVCVPRDGRHVFYVS